MDFASKTITERTVSGTRASVKEQEYLCHVFVRGDGLSSVIFADHEYPQRVAHTLINKVRSWGKSFDGSFIAYIVLNAHHSGCLI